MVKSFKQFINENFGYPTALEFYSDKIYDFCDKEFDKYLRSKAAWRSVDKKINIEFDNEHSFSEFKLDKVEVRFLIVNSKTKPHQCVEGQYDGNNNNIEIRINLDFNKKSITPSQIRVEMMETIRHELLHSYENFFMSKKGKQPLYILSTSNYDKYGPEMSHFFYLIYFCQPGEVNAHIGQLFDESEDVRNTINELINFNYLSAYTEIYKAMKAKGYDLLYLNSIVNAFVDEYRESCDTIGVEPYEKMLELKDTTFLNLMKYWQPIFHKIGKRALRKYYKRVKY